MTIKKIGVILTTLVTLLTAGAGNVSIVESKTAVLNASESIVTPSTTNLDEYDLVKDDMEWRYYDGDLDPNKGTWYESWNKRNGWAYPEGWLDWGMIEMKFSEASWPIFEGTKFSTTPAADTQTLATNSDGNAKSTYFLRHTFTLTQEQAKNVYALQIKASYNDAMTMYVNGTAVGGFHNIPTGNYKTNMEYGSQEVVEDGKPLVETFIVDDVSCITNGYVPGTYKTVYNEQYKMNVLQLDEPETDVDGNTFMNITIAVELHANSLEDAEASFELMEFVLNPDESALAAGGSVKNVAVNVGEDENTVNFAWNSLSSAAGYVQIAEGTDTSALAMEKATTYKANSTELAYTKFTATDYYANKAVVNVDAGKDYVYRVGNDDGYSQVYQLSTQDISDGYEAIFLSDAQIGTGTIPTDTLGWTTTLEKALGTFPEASFIVNTGDFVDTANKESEYDAYFTPEILASYPTATAVGNHDIAVNYKNHFNEPNLSALGASAANSDYYFTYGNVLYMVLNTSNINHGEHVQFMEETIAATADQDFDWKVVMFHQSIYASGKQSTSDDVPGRREAFVPAFDELGIDIVFMGHDHCYARTHQMKNFSPVEGVAFEDESKSVAVDPEGTLYLTTSSASGSKYYDLVVDNYEYLAFRDQSYVPTFSHISFSDEEFTMTAYRTDTMEVFDTYTIKKTKEDVVDTTEEYILSANDVNLTYKEATTLSEEDIIKLVDAKVINAETKEATDVVYDITVNTEELKAIAETDTKGGSYTLTLTATPAVSARVEQDNTLTKSITVKVSAKNSASTDPNAGSGANTGDTTGVSNLMWMLLLSGFVVSAVYLRKQNKKA